MQNLNWPTLEEIRQIKQISCTVMLLLTYHDIICRLIDELNTITPCTKCNHNATLWSIKTVCTPEQSKNDIFYLTTMPQWTIKTFSNRKKLVKFPSNNHHRHNNTALIYSSCFSIYTEHYVNILL